jgi:hypothetical protein
MAKTVADGLLSKAPEGTFFVRQSLFADEYVLSVVHLGVPTHYIVARNLDGSFAINKNRFGNVMSLHGLVDALRLPRPDWPIPLKMFVPHLGASEADMESESRFVELLERTFDIAGGEPQNLVCTLYYQSCVSMHHIVMFSPTSHRRRKHRT